MSSINVRLALAALTTLGALFAYQQLTGRQPDQPGSGAEPAGGKRPGNGDYWATRYTYPTFEFDSRWLTAARTQHERLRIANPGGERAPAGGDNLPNDRFTLLGPKPLNFGSSAVAGRTNAIVTHPGDDTVAYIGSDGGGVWKTSNCCDANTTWESLTDEPLFNSIAIGDLELDPADPDTVYAGTGDLRYGSFSFGSAGLLRSTDAGATWQILGTDVFGPVRDQPPGGFPQYQAIGKVEVDPRDSTNIVVGTKTGLFISYDDGANWTGPCLTNGFTDQRQDTTGLLLHDNGSATEVMAAVGTRGGPTPVQPDLDQNGANGIYQALLPASGCPSGWSLLSRPDNGWPAGTGDGNANGPLGRLELARAPSDPDVIYAEAVSPTSLGFMGVWRSTDSGGTWQQRATPANLSTCSAGGQSWYYAGLLVSPTNPDQVFLSSLNLFRSDDGGASFTGVTCNDNVHVDHHGRAFVGNDPARLLIGNDGGVYYSDNADVASPNQIDYIQLNDTLPTIEFYSGDITADFATSSERGAVGGAQDNGSSVVSWNGPVTATNWTPVLGGDGIYSRIEPVLEQRWYVEFQNGNLFVSQNGPTGSYSPVNGPWDGDTRSFLFPFEIYKHECPPATGCERLIAGSFRVWETIDGGLSRSDWYPNSPDLTKGVLADRSFINQLAYAFTDPTIAIAGTNDGNVWFGFGLGQGVDNSAAWVDVTDANAALPNRPVLDVVTDPVEPTIGYAVVGGFDDNTPATPGHVFRVECNSDCSAFTWENKSGNLPNIPVNSVMTNPNFADQVFAGSDWGLYYTNDITAASPEWMRFTAGLPPVMIWDMAVDRGATTLALFTRSRGAYAWPLPQGPEILLSDGFEALPR